MLGELTKEVLKELHITLMGDIITVMRHAKAGCILFLYLCVHKKKHGQEKCKYSMQANNALMQLRFDHYYIELSTQSQSK